MRAVWKWVIGIVIVLVVLALFAGGVWVLGNRFAAMHRIVQVGPRTLPSPNTPNTPNGQNPYYYGGPMMPYGGRGYPGMPMMRGRGFGFGILPIIGFIAFLFFVGIIVLIVLGIIALVRNQSRGAAVVPPAAATATAAAATTHPCSNCGQPVEDGFPYCPHCGTKQ